MNKLLVYCISASCDLISSRNLLKSVKRNHNQFAQLPDGESDTHQRPWLSELADKEENGSHKPQLTTCADNQHHKKMEGGGGFLYSIV